MYTEGQLTRQLTKQYDTALIRKLTKYDPAKQPIALKELMTLNGEESRDTLHHLWNMERPEVLRMHMEQREEIQRSKQRAFSRQGSAMSPVLVAPSDSPTAPEYPRWYDDGGGFITPFHRGRHCLDPKQIPVSTPGPVYNPLASLDAIKQRSGGSSFGSSRSERGILPSRKPKNRKQLKEEREKREEEEVSALLSAQSNDRRLLESAHAKLQGTQTEHRNVVRFATESAGNSGESRHDEKFEEEADDFFHADGTQRHATASSMHVFMSSGQRSSPLTWGIKGGSTSERRALATSPGPVYDLRAAPLATGEGSSFPGSVDAFAGKMGALGKMNAANHVASQWLAIKLTP